MKHLGLVLTPFCLANQDETTYIIAIFKKNRFQQDRIDLVFTIFAKFN